LHDKPDPPDAQRSLAAASRRAPNTAAPKATTAVPAATGSHGRLNAISTQLVPRDVALRGRWCDPLPPHTKVIAYDSYPIAIAGHEHMRRLW